VQSVGLDRDHINNWDPRWCQNLSPTAANPHNFSEKYSAEKPLPPINMHGLLNLRTDPAMVVCNCTPTALPEPKNSLNGFFLLASTLPFHTET
jgi:hypothetical protein